MPRKNARTLIVVMGHYFLGRQVVVPLRASGIAIEPSASPRKNLLLNVVSDLDANAGLARSHRFANR